MFPRRILVICRTWRPLNRIYSLPPCLPQQPNPTNDKWTIFKYLGYESFSIFLFFWGPNFLPFLTYGQGPNKSFQGPKMGPEPHFAHLCANATNVLW